ncbi:hypothetical protein KLP28_06080 [Nocardioidaceae bacterium]|nr:hypothetical protein KLP28_06080 [Nocardioidaceae bacterium]
MARTVSSARFGRATGRFAVAAALALPLAATTATPATAATRTTPAADEKTASAPRLPYIVGDVLTDGDASITLDGAPVTPLSVTRVATPGDGRNWVVTELMRSEPQVDDLRISRYVEDGSRVTLARTNTFEEVGISDRSTRLAYATDLPRQRSRVTVIDSYTGEVLAARRFPRAQVLDVDENQVVLSRRAPKARAHTFAVSWDYRRSTVDVLLRRDTYGADINADRLTVARGGRIANDDVQVRRLSDPRDVVIKRIPFGRAQLGWNSSGRRFLEGFSGASLGQITVRRDPQYTVASRLDGRRTDSSFSQAVWESKRRYVTVEFDEDSARLLRCDLRSRCTQVTDSFPVEAPNGYVIDEPTVLLGS